MNNYPVPWNLVLGQSSEIHKVFQDGRIATGQSELYGAKLIFKKD